MRSPEMMETLAAIEHERWSGWMKYLFSQCDIDRETGKLIIPTWACERWGEKIETPYAKLSEAERESDRAEVRKTLAALAATPPQGE